MSSRSTPGVASTQTAAGDGDVGAGDERDSVTTIGVDFGLRKLLVAAPVTDDPLVERALEVDGDGLEETFDEFRAATRGLRELDVETWPAEGALLRECQAWFRARFADAAVRLLAYCEAVDADVVALEDPSWEPKPLAEYRHGSGGPSPWLLPACQEYIRDVLEESDYRVILVAPEGTSQECHVCGREGTRGSDGLRCYTDECPVTTVDGDRSAAVTIARRGHPAGG